MRILHLSNHCDEVGNGIMNVAVDLACAQSVTGHHVVFASGGGSYVTLLAQHGVTHEQIRQEWKRPHALPASFLMLRRLVMRQRPDIIHAHMMTGAILGKLMRYLPGGGRMRLVTTVHNEWQKTAILMTLGDKVIAVSDAVSRQMAARGIPVSKLMVVANGPLGSPRRATAPEPMSPPLLRPAIVTVGGLYERKGIRELIEAFAAIAASRPDVQLHIVGDGPDREAFRAAASVTPVADRIHFAGFQRDPRRWLESADIFVLASRSEPFGLVLAEAREAGLAVIGTHVGGIPEVLEDGRAGILVPPHDPGALAAALGQLLDSPDELLRWRRLARSNLGWLSVKRMAEETVGVYEAALAPAGVRLARPEAQHAG
jgi:glycosyltransferase involved in cell wall biosynthesis